MFLSQKNDIKYKWDDDTCSGFRIRLDGSRAKLGARNRFHVEDWNHNFVVDEWGCDTLEEALGVLQQFFDVDIDAESTKLKQRLD